MTRPGVLDPLGRFVRHAPLPAPAVDIPRFMGTWYVLGGILTPIERFAHNPVERYTLEPDGSIDTHFRFHRHALPVPARQSPRTLLRAAVARLCGR